MTTRQPVGSDKGISSLNMSNPSETSLSITESSSSVGGWSNKSGKFKLWFLVPIFGVSFLVFWFWKPKWVCHLKDNKHHVQLQLVLLYSLVATAIIGAILWYAL